MLKAFAPVTRRKEIRARCQQISTSIWPTVQTLLCVYSQKSHMYKRFRCNSTDFPGAVMSPSLDNMFRNLKTKTKISHTFLFCQPCGNDPATAFCCLGHNKKCCSCFCCDLIFEIWSGMKKKLTEILTNVFQICMIERLANTFVPMFNILLGCGWLPVKQ